VGPKSLAVTGRAADGWVPSMGSDWLSARFRESRPLIDEAAAKAGRDPAEIANIFNFGGQITSTPLAETRGDDGRWIGGSAGQWIEEMTAAVLEHQAGGFIYRSTDETPAPVAVARFAQEIVPAVRDAVSRALARRVPRRRGTSDRSPWPLPAARHRFGANAGVTRRIPPNEVRPRRPGHDCAEPVPHKPAGARHKRHAESCRRAYRDKPDHGKRRGANREQAKLFRRYSASSELCRYLCSCTAE
jgi:hypothetical protein